MKGNATKLNLNMHPKILPFSAFVVDFHQLLYVPPLGTCITKMVENFV